MKPYTPRPGTLPARLIEHLTATGGTMTTKQIANGFAEPANNVGGLLVVAIKHRVIVMHKTEAGNCYGLPDSSPGDVAPAPAAHLTLGTPVEKAAKKTPAKKTTKRRAPSAPAAVQAVDASPPAIAALWDDGDIVLYGLQVNADNTVTLAGAQAQRVHRFLERCFGPNE